MEKEALKKLIRPDLNGMMLELNLALPRGLHARPSARLAKIAQNFSAQIFLRGKNGEADAKSMLEILSLSAQQKDRLSIHAQGPDAMQALLELGAFLTEPQIFADEASAQALLTDLAGNA